MHLVLLGSSSVSGGAAVAFYEGSEGMSGGYSFGCCLWRQGGLEKLGCTFGIQASCWPSSWKAGG